MSLMSESTASRPVKSGCSLDSSFVGDPRTLQEWLGSFWNTIYTDKDFLRSLCAARGLTSAQAYLDLAEAASTLDRNGTSVFHRERWHPIVIRESEANSGSASLLRFDMDPPVVFGVQTDPAYNSAVFNVGGSVSFSDINVYPAPAGILSARCLVDNVMSPNVVLTAGVDFAVVDGAVAIRKASDPFAGGFPIDNIVDDSGSDRETVLWLCDAEFDTGLVPEHLGYPLGLESLVSSEGFKRVVNAAWDVLSSGPTQRLLQALIGAICGVPTVASRSETVDRTFVDPATGEQVVATDKRLYRFPSTANLRPAVEPGATLEYGEFMDSTIKVYPQLTINGLNKIIGISEHGATLRRDVPAVTIPRTCFRAPLRHGVSVSWEQVPIVSAGLDANGNPKLWFDIGADDEDTSTFWADVWAESERSGTSMEACLAGAIDGIVSYEAGSTCGHVSPLEFFLGNLIGANTLIVAVQSSGLGGAGSATDMRRFFDLLKAAIPTHARLFFIERRGVGSSSADLESSGSSAATYAFAERRSVARPGAPSRAKMTYGDGKIRARWVPVCS